MELPLFPLHTVLFPGGLLPLKIFEQRYVEMTKACLKNGTPFGVCLIKRGNEVAANGAPAPEFAGVGTLASVASCDVPQPGIFHVRSHGGERFEVRSHSVRSDGLVIGDVAPIPTEPAVAITPAHAALVRFLELLAERLGPQQFPEARAYDDASWVGYRLAELLPLPLPIKQGMLEINDSELRLAMLRKFLTAEGLLRE